MVDAAGIITCTGDQSGGISYDSNNSEMVVKELTKAITPTAGTQGIHFSSTSGENVVLQSGEQGANICIQTQNASGIYLNSTGISIGLFIFNPPLNTLSSVLGIPIPGHDDLSGGVVKLESYSDITANVTDRVRPTPTA